MKSALSKQFLMNAAVSAASFIVAIKGTKYLLMIPGVAKMNKFIGILHIVLGGVLVAKVRNPMAKSLGAGLAAAGAFDLIAKLSGTALGLPTLLGMDSEVMGAAYVPGMTEVMGANYTPGMTEVLGTEYAGTEYAGNDAYGEV